MIRTVVDNFPANNWVRNGSEKHYKYQWEKKSVEVVLCTFMHMASLQSRKKPGDFPAGFPAVRTYM